MNADSFVPVEQRTLHPCALIACREEMEISTLLGSCVSVCLWEPRLGFGGMNHYMLPTWNGEGAQTPKYGDVAIEKLIMELMVLGCRKEHLVAKCFGGAKVIEDATDRLQIGARNIALAEELLAAHGIPVVARKVGGPLGFKITFNTKSGLVLAGHLPPLASLIQKPTR
jgi:chemotaxis protein CheD